MRRLPYRGGVWTGLGLPQYASREEDQLIQGQEPQFQISRIGLEGIGGDVPDAQVRLASWKTRSQKPKSFSQDS